MKNELKQHPLLFVVLKPKSKQEVNLQYTNYRNYGDFRDYASEYMLNNYRNLNHFPQQTVINTSLDFGINWDYHNLLHLFFGKSEIGLSKSESNITTSQVYRDYLCIINYLNKPQNAVSKYVNSLINQGLEIMSCLITINASYKEYSSTYTIQGITRQYVTNNLNIELTTYVRSSDWMSLNLINKWNNSSYNLGNGTDKQSCVNSVANNIDIYIKLTKDQIAKLTGELYFDNKIYHYCPTKIQKSSLKYLKFS